ncbi:uncharacterized protein LOC133906043 [Phragmites australis]|uniref:uncharacterized protein LOC133906043 n=1 Tax=Phragmites australis TaxID=29695 RepID=UPI002D76C0EF|nr:uncharacterized protein LOC133906043 [Phragmites australis]
MAEWWYNTSYHTSLKITPFQALYGYPPPQIGELSIPCNISDEARITIEEKEKMLKELKLNLSKAQERTKHFADKGRTERSFTEGDMVYLKLQPYRYNAFGLRGSIKLRSKYYGPFRVIKRVGMAAYKLLLPDGVNIHPVFHVNQLKKHLGAKAVPLPNLPLVTAEGKIKTEPLKVLERRIVPRNHEAVAQWLVQWENLSADDSTWEDAKFIQSVFPHFNP